MTLPPAPQRAGAHDCYRCIYMYADILGYKAHLRQLGVQELAHRLAEALAVVDSHVMAENLRIAHRRLHEDPPHLRRLFKWSQEGSFGAYFAFDTLVVYFKDVTDDTLSMRLSDFLTFCATLYLALLVEHDFLLRGVVSMTRDYVFQERIIALANIDEAVTMEKAQQWAGIVISIADFDAMWWNEGTRAEDSVLSYPVPLEHDERPMFVLNPVNKRTVQFLHKRQLSLSFRVADLLEHARDPKCEARVAKKLLNTATFLGVAKRGYELGLKRERLFGPLGAEFDVP